MLDNFVNIRTIGTQVGLIGWPSLIKENAVIYIFDMEIVEGFFAIYRLDFRFWVMLENSLILLLLNLLICFYSNKETTQTTFPWNIKYTWMFM